MGTSLLQDRRATPSPHPPPRAQGEELEPARQKAEAAGVKEIFIDDLREEFVRDYVFPMFRANALYEGTYLLGTSIARPLIAKRQIEIARAVGADAVSHGATGKGNDQVRFELGYLGLQPDINVIAPWREWDLNSRSKLIEYAESRGIAVPQGKRNEPPFSMDANLLHISYEGNALEDPWQEPSESMFTRSVSPEQVPFILRLFLKGGGGSMLGRSWVPCGSESRVGSREQGLAGGGVPCCLELHASLGPLPSPRPHPPRPPTRPPTWRSTSRRATPWPSTACACPPPPCWPA